MLTQKLITTIRQHLLIPLLVLLMNCHRAERIEIKEVRLVSMEEEIGGPPPRYKSEFKTIEAWLTDMCKNDTPEKAIDEYRIGVMKSNANYLLYVAGMSIKQNSADSSFTSVAFEPRHMYFVFPETAFRDSGFNEVFAALTPQIRSFSNNEIFKHSFFTKADKVTFAQKTIWSRP